MSKGKLKQRNRKLTEASRQAKQKPRVQRYYRELFAGAEIALATATLIKGNSCGKTTDNLFIERSQVDHE